MRRSDCLFSWWSGPQRGTAERVTLASRSGARCICASLMASLCLVCMYPAAGSPPQVVAAPATRVGTSASEDFQLTGRIAHVAQQPMSGGQFTLSMSPLASAPADRVFSNGFEVAP